MPVSLHVVRRFVTFIVLISVCVTLSNSAKAEPKVKFTDGTFSFGKVSQHVILSHRFWLKSVGTDTAHITEALPDCSCTELFVSDSTIAPGDSISVDILLNSRSFIGFINKRPHIIIRGRSDSTYCMMYAEVMVEPENSRPLVITPIKVDVSQFGTKTRRKASFIIENRSAQTYQVSVVDSAFKSFSVSLPAIIRPNEKAEGKITVRKDRVAGSFAESFSFEVDDDGRTRFAVPVVREYRPQDEASAASK